MSRSKHTEAQMIAAVKQMEWVRWDLAPEPLRAAAGFSDQEFSN